MKSHTIESLVPNSYFTEQVYLEDKYIILSPDIPVTRELIDRLKKWNYLQIYCEGDCVVHPHKAVLKNVGESGVLLDKVIQEKEKYEGVMTYYFNLISFMDEYIKLNYYDR